MDLNFHENFVPLLKIHLKITTKIIVRYIVKRIYKDDTNIKSNKLNFIANISI